MINRGFKMTISAFDINVEKRTFAIDLSPYNQNFDLGKSREIFHHSLKEHHKISNIPKFRCEML